MLRGEISNRPAAIYAVDYRILVEPKRPYAWFVLNVPELLFQKGFENTMKKAFPWKRGARLWLENHWDKRIAVFSVGEPMVARAIDMRVGDFIAETYHFEDAPEFRLWLNASKHLAKVYTKDVALIGLDDIVELHTGWTEEI